MELCKQDLADWLKNSDEIVRERMYLVIFKQIIDAVKHLRKRCLIFRDLKVNQKHYINFS